MVSVSTDRTQPRITFTALCEFLDASFVRQTSILREQKFPQLNQLRNYQRARAQVQALAVYGQQLDPRQRDLRSWEEEVVQLLANRNWKPPARCLFPSTRREGLELRGVKVSVHPDLLLLSEGDRRPDGAMKLFFPKSVELSPSVGRSMAAFLYQYRTQVDKDGATDLKKCVVFDVRKDVTYSAGRSHKTLFRNVEEACETIAARWPRIAAK